MSSYYKVDEPLPSGIEKRILTITDGSSHKQVEHLVFTNWKDKKAVGDDARPCVQYLIERGLQARSNPKDIVLVHCSAGIGRTGTYIALMLMIESINYQAKVLK